MWIDDEYDELLDCIYFPSVQNQIELCPITSLSEAFDEIKEKLHNYDYIILDINLSRKIDQQEETDGGRWASKQAKLHYPDEKNNDEEQREETDEGKENYEQSSLIKFYEIAGFALFMMLLDKGFPKDRIVFLTGNAKDELIRYKEKCRSNFIEPPEGYGKEDENEFIKGWLHKNFRNEESNVSLKEDLQNKYNYLTLRRGIMNVIDDLVSHNKTVNEDWKQDIDGKAFLDNLKWLIANHNAPSNNDLPHAYAVICDAIVKPFERYSLDIHSGGIYYKLDDIKNWIKEGAHLVYPPYFLRNWLAHGVLRKSNTILEANDVAFIFILVIQQLFNVFILDKDYKHRGEFADLLPVNKDKNVEDLIVSLEDEYIGMSKDPKDPLLIIDHVGYRKDIEKGLDFRKHLYASFLFPLRSPGKKKCHKHKPSGGNIFQENRMKSYVVNYYYYFDIDDTKRILSEIALSRMDKITNAEQGINHDQGSGVSSF